MRLYPGYVFRWSRRFPLSTGYPPLQPYKRCRFSSTTAQPSSSSPSPEIAEELISSLPLIRYLRSCTSTTINSKPIYTEFRPYKTMHPAAQSTHLVKTALVNTQRLTVDPIFFLKSESQSEVQSQSASTQIIAATYISRHTTGHAGFVHGGLSTLLLDDIFARLAAEIFPSRIGMTARLGMDFRAPGLPERVYILRAVLDRVEGERRNKVWMKGEMRCLGGFQVEEMAKRGIVEGDGVSEEEQEGVLVARAEGLFVEPRDVKGMVPLYPREEGAL